MPPKRKQSKTNWRKRGQEFEEAALAARQSRDLDVLERVEAEVVESADLLNLDDDERTLTEEMEADFDSDDAKGNVSARIEEEAERAVADLDDDDDDLT